MHSLIQTFLCLAVPQLISSSPLGTLEARVPDDGTVGPDNNPDLVGYLWDSMINDNSNPGEQPSAGESSVTHDGNSSTYISITFPDSEEDGPGFTIDIDRTLSVDTRLGPYTFSDGHTSEGATFKEIFEDYNTTSRRLAPTKLKNAVLELEDTLLDLFDHNGYQCNWDNGPSRKLLQDREPGHLSAGIGHALVAGGSSVGFAYAGTIPNATRIEAALTAGAATIVSIAVGRMFDALQRRGAFNAADAAIGACFLAAASFIGAGLLKLGEAASGAAACFTEPDLRQAEQAVANPDYDGNEINRPDLGFTSWNNAIGGRARDAGAGGIKAKMI